MHTRRLRIQLHDDFGSYGFRAGVVEFPACVAVARTIGRLRAAITEAITLYFDDLGSVRVRWDTPGDEWPHRMAAHDLVFATIEIQPHSLSVNGCDHD